MTEEEKKDEEIIKKDEEVKKDDERKIGWNPVQSGRSVTHGTSTSETKVDVDTSGYDKPTEYDFNTPERKKFEYDPTAGILGVLNAPKPERDVEREERLKKLAKVNALGDFTKNLAAFAGTGYAPVEKRGENKQVIRAFDELNRLNDIYDARNKEHADRMFNLGVQDYAYQRGRADDDYNRAYNDEKERASRQFQIEEGIRQNKEKAHYESNTKRTTTQNGETDIYKNFNLLMTELSAKKSGSGKDENYYMYLRGVGDLKISKDAQIQIGTRIVDSMLKAERITEHDAGGMLRALNGPNSRNAFQAMTGYMRYKDVYEACKQFFGHGMENLRPEEEGYPLDNDGDTSSGKNMLQSAYSNQEKPSDKSGLSLGLGWGNAK